MTQTRIITVIPINFQNDRREPETPEAIRASLAQNDYTDDRGFTYGNLLRDSTNGQITLDVRVLPYVTLPYDRPTVLDPGARSHCTSIGGTSFQSAGRQAAIAAGHTIAGTAWVYVPQYFGTCSEYDRVGLQIHGGFRHLNFPFIFQTTLGLSGQMPAWSWICKAPNGNWANVSASCASNGQRHFRTAGGQAWGPMVANERVLLGTLAADRIRTIQPGEALPITVTLASLSGPAPPPVGQLQAVHLPGWAIGDSSTGVGPGVTLEYHAQSGRWSNVLERGGLTATVRGTTKLLDFRPTPTGKVTPGGSGGHALMPGQSVRHPTNQQKITVVSVGADGLTFTVSAAESEEPPPPPPPPPPPDCAVTPDGIFGLSVTVAENGECITYYRTATNQAILRHRKGDSPSRVEQVGDGVAVGACGGVLHLKSGNGNYYRRDFAIRTWTNLGPTVPCVSGEPPPPPPPPPPPTWTVVPGTIERDSAGALRLTIDGVTFGVVRQ